MVSTCLMDPYFAVDADVGRARTPPPALYGDPRWHAHIRERVLARSWHLLLEPAGAPQGANVIPASVLGEPLLWTRSDDGERLLSGVCTHRGAVMVDEPCRVRSIRCPYHGRRFRLDGSVAAAPGFESAPSFPEARDALVTLPLTSLGPWRFGALSEAPPASEWLDPVVARVPWFPFGALVHDPTGDRRHELGASWALYVENYLEGFHIPYVHPGLARVLEASGYRTERLPLGTLQVGLARPGEACLEPPPGQPDHGERVGGYYFWLFPTTMLNLYPWGVSVNAVEPTGPRSCVVHYQRWVLDPAAPREGAGGDLDTVEREDQAVVARAQRGVSSRLYGGGRYSPEHEVGVHHFHRLLAAAL